MSVVTRFAPSPTGRLHVGNIRTALHNLLFARKHRGDVLLRIDDTDRERSTAEFDQAIRDDLGWLGLIPDRTVRQSERFDLYEREFERLKAAGRVYACYETPEELDLRRKVLLGRGLPPVYERKPVGTPAPEGRVPHWRFRLDHDAADRLDRPHPRRAEVRSEALERPSRPPRRRQLALPAAERHRRCRPRRHPHRPRRGPRLQQCRPDPDVRSAWRPAARLCARGAPRRRRGQAVEAVGVVRRRAGSVRRPRTDGAAVCAGADRHVAARSSRSPLSTSLRATSTSRRFGRAPAHFDPHEVELVNARLFHRLDFATVAERLPQRRDRGGLAASPPQPRASVAISHGWLAVLHGDIDAPELGHEERLAGQGGRGDREHASTGPTMPGASSPAP